MKHRENPFHRCERWWERRLNCPFVDKEDQEDEEDTEDHESRFDKKRDEAGEQKKVDVPAPVLEEAAETVAVREPSIPVVLEAFVTAGAEPAPVMPSRAPAITPFVPPPIKQPVEVPQVGKATGQVGSWLARAAAAAQLAEETAMVSAAVSLNTSEAYIAELEETGWQTYLESLSSLTRNVVSAHNTLRGPSLNPFVAAVIAAAAAERLYTRFVPGYQGMPEDKTKSTRKRGMRPGVHDPRKGPAPSTKKRPGVGAREGKATAKEADRSLRQTAKKGVTQTIRSIGGRGTGGRGGFLKMAETFRPSFSRRRKVSKRRKANVNYRPRR